MTDYKPHNRFLRLTNFISVIFIFSLINLLPQCIQAQSAKKTSNSDRLRTALNEAWENLSNQPTAYKNELLAIYQEFSKLELDDSLRFGLYRATGISYGNLNNSDSAHIYFYKAKNLLNKLDIESSVSLYLAMANTFQSDLPSDSARHYLELALDIAQKLNDKFFKASAYSNLGNYYLGHYNYSKAYDYYRAALVMLEELDDKKNVAIVKANIGMILQNMGRGKEAISMIEEATAFHEKEGNTIQLLNNYGNLAIYYKEENDFDKSLEYSNKAIDLALKNDMKRDLARFYFNTGNLLRNMRKLQESEIYHLNSLEICQQLNLDFGVMVNQHALGLLYNELKRPNDALPWLNLALQSATRAGDLEVLKNVYLSMSDAYEQTNKFSEALNYHKLFKQYNDSLVRLENRQLILDLEDKYQLEKKDAENQLLREENQRKAEVIRLTTMFNITMITLVVFLSFLIIYMIKSRRKIKKLNRALHELNEQVVTKNQALQELNATKDKLFSIIGHDLRSPFNALLGLLQFVIEEENEISWEERQNALKSVFKQSKTTYALLENLLTWSMSQKNAISFNPGIRFFYPVLEEEIEFLGSRAADKNITIINEIPQEESGWFDKQMVATIFRNIINNAIKFSEPYKRIHIRSNTENDKIHIIIADEGRGMTDDVLALIRQNHSYYSSVGTRQEKGSGLGLLIVKDFMRHNQAELNIQSELGKGSTFTLSFKKTAPHE